MVVLVLVWLSGVCGSGKSSVGKVLGSLGMVGYIGIGDVIRRGLERVLEERISWQFWQLFGN